MALSFSHFTITGHFMSFSERLKVLQNHCGEEIMLPDVFVSLLAKLAPKISIQKELERTLRTRFGVICEIAVLPVGDLRT